MISTKHAVSRRIAANLFGLSVLLSLPLYPTADGLHAQAVWATREKESPWVAGVLRGIRTGSNVLVVMDAGNGVRSFDPFLLTENSAHAQSLPLAISAGLFEHGSWSQTSAPEEIIVTRRDGGQHRVDLRDIPRSSGAFFVVKGITPRDAVILEEYVTANGARHLHERGRSVLLLVANVDDIRVDTITVLREVDTVQLIEAPNDVLLMRPQPFGRPDLLAISSDGRFAAVVRQQDTATVSIRIHDLRTYADTEFSYEVVPRRISSEDVDEAVSSILKQSVIAHFSDRDHARRVIRGSLYTPRHRPNVLGVLIASTGSIWLLERRDGLAQQWRRYTLFGDQQPTACTPHDVLVEEVTEDMVWGIEQEDARSRIVSLRVPPAQSSAASDGGSWSC